MLIRFSVQNHLSVRSLQELSLVASGLRDPSVALFDTGSFKLVPAAVIYGANASGKSNFISALGFFRNAVLYSHSRGGPDAPIPRNPFLLDERSRDEPTKMDIDFILDGVRFHYGFSANDRSFEDEWLYAFPSGKRQLWFYRDSSKNNINFGKNLRGALKTIESLTRQNSLFLSAAAQNAHKQLTPIYNYISRVSIKYRIENRDMHVISAFADGKIDSRIINFLVEADTGIIGARFEEQSAEGDRGNIMKDLIDVLKKHVPETNLVIEEDDLPPKVLFLAHKVKDGADKFFGLDLESSGTLRMLVLLKVIFEALDKGSLVVIDELDASLHTHLVEKLVALFNSKSSNLLGAQLIATTHDNNLLCGDLLRRDQIWFAEKDGDGATNLYPLTDIRTRNTDNLEKGYLQGRFGAVPFRGAGQLLSK